MTDGELEEKLGSYYEMHERRPAPDVSAAVMSRVGPHPIRLNRFVGIGGTALVAAGIAAVLIVGEGVHAVPGPVPGGSADGASPLASGSAATTPVPSVVPTVAPTGAVPTSFNGSSMSVSGGLSGPVVLDYINCNVKASTAYENVVFAGTVGSEPFFVQIQRGIRISTGQSKDITDLDLTNPANEQTLNAQWQLVGDGGISYGADTVRVHVQLAPDQGSATAPVEMTVLLSCANPPSNPSRATTLTLSGAVSGTVAVTSVTCNFPEADVVNGTLNGHPITVTADSPQTGGPSTFGNPLTVRDDGIQWTTTSTAGMVFGNATDSFSDVSLPSPGTGPALTVSGTLGCSS